MNCLQNSTKMVSIILALAGLSACVLMGPEPHRGMLQVEKPIIGADISWLPSQEDRGMTFSDHGVAKDALEILKDHNFNWIRLRLFVDPTAEKGYSRDGYCGLEQTIAMAKRIKAADMQFLLDFHYSDNWADPGKQYTPAAWTDLNAEELENKIYEYTLETLKRFGAEGVMPEMVQVGNEVHNGILWPLGKRSDYPENFGKFMGAASRAVRKADPNIIIMAHIAKGGSNKESIQFYEMMNEYDVVYDVIGQSYYPQHHGTLDDLTNNLTDLAIRYKKPIIVVEYQEHRKEVNEIVKALPNGVGWGTFIWEATSSRWGNLFDREGAANENMEIYPEFYANRPN